jgi:ankyrin repeat protein
LIECGVDIDACLHPPLGDTAFAAAIENGHLKIVQLLVNRGADPTANHYDGNLFVLAVRQNHPPVAAFLFSRGASSSGRFYKPWVNELLEDAGIEQ